MLQQKSKVDLIAVPVVRTRLHNTKIFKTERPYIEKYKCNPLYRGAMLWNSLSVKIRNIDDYQDFKGYFKNWAHNVTMLNYDWEHNN